jgi:hypothetical protein
VTIEVDASLHGRDSNEASGLMKKLSARHTLMVFISAVTLLAVVVGVQYGEAQSGYPARVTTETLTMTGLSARPVQVITETLTMTGRSDQPMQIYTDTLTMTGQLSKPMHVITDTMTMKGMP